MRACVVLWAYCSFICSGQPKKLSTFIFAMSLVSADNFCNVLSFQSEMVYNLPHYLNFIAALLDKTTVYYITFLMHFYSKITEYSSRVSTAHRYHSFGLKLYPVGCAQDRYLKTRKMLCFGSGSAHATKFRNISR